MEKIATGLQITIIGMTVVFLILILISLALKLMQVLIYKRGRSTKASGTKELAPAVLDRGLNQDQGHFIAVLTAAILAAGETKAPFRPLSIHAVSETRSTWKKNARTLTMVKLPMLRFRRRPSIQ